MLTDQTIEVYRGEQVRLTWTMTPLEDISGHTLVFTVTKGLNRTTKVLGPLPITILSGPAGTFERLLTEEQMNLNPATYNWDVWRVDEGFEGPKAIGPFVVRPNVRVPPIE